jgi:predicted anti-sigma-YlaC factor YlaD
MTACPKWKDRLLDFALGVPASSELQMHLKTCSACAAAFVELRARSQEMDRLLPKLMHGVEPSAAFRARLMASLEEPPPRMRGWPMRVGVLAALALVVVVAVLLVSSSHWRIGLREPDRVSVSTGGLAEWQSPTGYLLHSSGNELLRSDPQLGKFYFPLRSAPLGSGHGENRME